MTSVSALASRIRERKWALLSFALLLAAVMAAGWPSNARRSEVPDLPRREIAAPVGGSALVQSLPSPFSHIETLHLLVRGGRADTGCRVRLMAGDTLLAESTLVPGGAEPAWADVPVSRAVPPGGAALRIQIEGVGGSDAVFFISPYPSAAEPLMLDGAAQDGRLVYALTGTVDSAEKPVLWLIILALGLAALLMLGEDIRRNFCVLAAALGMIALIVQPIGAGFDEHRHFARAWQLAGDGLAPLRTQDGAAIPVPLDVTPLTTAGSYRIAQALSAFSRSPSGETALSREYAVENTLFIGYLPSAVGVALGRLAGLPLWLIYYLGRLTNLAAYIGLVYAALRVAPRFRSAIFAVGLLAQAVTLAASYSTDPVVIALTLLFTALWLRYAYDGGLSLRRMGAMAGILCAIAFIKAPYALLALLFLFTPRSAFTSPRLRWAAAAMAAAVWTLAAAWLLAVNALWGGVPNSAMRDGAANALAQLRHMAAHPGGALIMLARCLTSLTGGWLAELSVYDSGRMNAGIWQALTPLALVWAGLGNGAALPAAQRRSLLVTAALTVCGLILFLYMAWSDVGAALPWGIQGRYFIPVFALLLPALGRRERAVSPVRLGWVMALMGAWTMAAMVGYYY